MSNLNAIRSTWPLRPTAHRGLCWVSLTSRPCHGKLWSTSPHNALPTTRHQDRASVMNHLRSSGQKEPTSYCALHQSLCRQGHHLPASPAGCLAGNPMGRSGLHTTLQRVAWVGRILKIASFQQGRPIWMLPHMGFRDAPPVSSPWASTEPSSGKVQDAGSRSSTLPMSTSTVLCHRQGSVTKGDTSGLLYLQRGHPWPQADPTERELDMNRSDLNHWF